MTTNPDNPADHNPEKTLRQRAEDALDRANWAANTPSSPLDALKLMHELQVHQIELELQNEELIQAGAELEASLEKYTDLYEFAPVGYCTLDRNGYILQMNLTAADIFQIERSALIGLRLDGLISPDSRPVFREYLERVFQDLPSQHCEIQIPIQNQPAVDLRLTATSMPGGNKCRLAFENITAIKLAEAELIASEANLSNAQHIAHIGSWQFDPMTQRFAWSAEVYRICERDPSLGPPALTDCNDLILSEDWETFDRAFQHAIHQGAGFQLELGILRPDGDVRKVEMLGECKMDGRRRLVEIFGSIQDITERKRMEEQLRSALTEKEWLMREVHHRVKNNLEVIASLTYLQIKRTPDPVIQAGLQDLEQRIHTIALVHEQLYQSEVLSCVDAQGFLEKLILELHQGSGDSDIQISIDANYIQLEIDKAIPLGLIVNEMVSNAFKHAFRDIQYRSGRPDLMISSAENSHARISISLEPDQEKLILKVSDNGVGLPADMDWQGTRTLGMRLVNRLSQQLNGKLTISTQAGTSYALIFEP